MKLNKAIFPVAGLGTRFLPATKSVPKEMMPIFDKPVIQFAVDEAIEAGIDTLIFVTGRSKRAIADYFDRSPELEAELERKNKIEALNSIKQIVPDNVKCVFIRQPQPLGLGHAVLCAKDLIRDDEYFAVLLPDDLIDSPRRGCLAQMAEHHEETMSSVIAVEKVPEADVSKYGILGLSPSIKDKMSINQIVEKPPITTAPSNLAVVGRYILSGRIMCELERTNFGSGGELQLTDAIASRLVEEEFLAFRFAGTRFDCGDKIGFLKANVHYGLKAGAL